VMAQLRSALLVGCGGSRPGNAVAYFEPRSESSLDL